MTTLFLFLEKKQHLEFIQQQEMTKSCEPVEESSSENIFMDCSIGIDYVDINRPSNYFRHSLNESVLHSSSGEQDHTGHLLGINFRLCQVSKIVLIDFISCS